MSGSIEPCLLTCATVRVWGVADMEVLMQLMHSGIVELFLDRQIRIQQFYVTGMQVLSFLAAFQSLPVRDQITVARTVSILHD